MASTPRSSPRFQSMDGARNVSQEAPNVVCDVVHLYRAWNGSTPFPSPRLGSVDALGPLKAKDHPSPVNYLPQTLPVRTASPVKPCSPIIHVMDKAATMLGRHEEGVPGIEGQVIVMPTHPPLLDLPVRILRPERSTHPLLLRLSGPSDSDSDVGGGNEESPVVMELGIGGAWQEKSREEGPYLSRVEESVQTSTSPGLLHSPRLEIKRQLYNMFHDTMQYARNKGDMELHRMISGSPRASS